MRKILSLIMIAVMLMSVPCYVTAETSVDDSAGNSTAVSFLTKIGIIDISNEAMKESIVTREDFAVYIANLLGVDTDAEATTRYFSDVSMGSYGAKAIEALTELNIISRAADDKFRPDDNITYEEAIKMLFVAAGYGAYSEARGGYPLGYMKTARENRFLISVADNGAISVEEAAEMIYEAAQINMYEPVSFGSENVEYTASAGNTIFSVYHNIYFDKGTVTGVYGRTINFDTPPEKGYMEINGESFYAGDDVNKDSSLGDYVKYFYIKDSTGKQSELVYAESIGEKAVTFEISRFNSYDGSKISYLKEDGSGKIESKSLDAPGVIYNGYPVKTDISEIFKSLNKGYITIKDSNNDNTYDLILIDDYETVVVSGIDNAKQIIYNESGDGKYIDCNEYRAVKIYDDSMNTVVLSDVGQSSVLSVAKTWNSKELLTAVMSGIQVNGVLDLVKQGENVVAEINGIEYTVDKNYAEEFKNEARPGNNYYYRCDFMGEIVYVSSSSTDTMSYAYVIDATCVSEPFGERAVLKVLDPGGNITDISFATDIKIDGRKYKDEGKKAYSAFLALGGGELKPSMIRYTLNENGEFKVIDTPFLNESYENDRSSLTPVYGYTDDFSTRYYREYRLGLKAYMTADTPVYCVPYKSVYGEIEQSEVMVQPVKSNSVLRIDAFYPSNLYTTNVANEFADVAAIRYKYEVLPSNSYDKTLVIVDEIREGIGSSGEAVRFLCGYTRGKRVEYEIDNRIELGDIEQGDLVQFNYSIWGKIIPAFTDGQPDVVVLYDYSLWQGGRPDSSTGVWKGIVEGGRCYLNNGGADSQYYNYNTQLSFGFANERTGNTIRFGYNSGSDFDEAIRVSGISVIVYDDSQREGNKVYVGSVNDVVGYKNAGDECSSVLVHTYHSQPRQIIVYN